MLRPWLFVWGLFLLGRVSSQASFSLTDFSNAAAVAQVIAATTATITTGGSLSCADPQHVAWNIALDGTPLPPGRMGFSITLNNVGGATGGGPPTCTSGGMPSTVATGLVSSVAPYTFGDASIYLRAGHAPAQGAATPSNALTCFAANVDSNGATQHNEISLCFSPTTPTQVDASYWIGQLANGDVPTTTTIPLGFDASQTYHTYGISWRTSGIQFFVDGVVVLTMSGDRLGYPWQSMNVRVVLRPTGSLSSPTVFLGNALISVGALSYAAAADPATFGGPPSAPPSPLPTLAPTPLLPGTSWAPTAPSAAPSARPTAATPVPSARPSAAPSLATTPAPTFAITPSPTARPTIPVPTALPTTPVPTSATPPPSAVPSMSPSALPTVFGTATPSTAPSPAPTPLPSTARPTAPPTPAPSSFPSPPPSPAPTTAPSPLPSSLPTTAPTANPSMIPNVPTPSPSALPTQPSPAPSALPTAIPSPSPSAPPTPSPSSPPSPGPSSTPTPVPSGNFPTAQPTPLASAAPSLRPSPPPSPLSSMAPSTALPTAIPSLPAPSPPPTRGPTSLPTTLPSPRPSAEPSVAPTAMPLMFPSSMPPSLTPTWAPSSLPTFRPSPQPSARPTIAPTGNNQNNAFAGTNGSFVPSNLIILGTVVAVALVIIGTFVLWCRSRASSKAEAAAAAVVVSANRGSKRPGSGGHYEDFGGAASQRFGDEILQSYALGDATANPIVGRTTPQERRSLTRLSIDYKDRMSAERRESFGVARLSADAGGAGGAGGGAGPDLGNSRPPPMLRPFAHHPL